MSDKKKDEDFRKAYELSTEPADFTPKTSVGQYRFFLLLMFLILGILAALFVFRYLAGQMNPNLSDKDSVNPLFFTGEENQDDDVPDIPGTKVYDIRKDVPEIEKDSSLHKEQFQQNLKQIEKNDKQAADAEMMKKRDNFAAEKLDFLRRIEQAESKEERVRLIRELEKKTGEQN